MFRKLFATLCLGAFLVVAVGCTDKTTVSQDPEGKKPTASSNAAGSSTSGTAGKKNGTMKLDEK